MTASLAPHSAATPDALTAVTDWRAAYDQHAAAVLAFLRRRLRDAAEAEDLLQETFVRAIGAGSYRGEIHGSLRGYLLTTARNLLINRLRRPRLVVAAADVGRGGDDAGSGDEVLERVADHAASPEEAAAWSDFRRRLAALVATLSEAHRLAFRLGVLEQQPYQEIARRTGWTLPQVKINVYRARKRVVAELGGVALRLSDRA